MKKRVKSKEEIMEILKDYPSIISIDDSMTWDVDFGVSFNSKMFDCCGKVIDLECSEWHWPSEFIEDICQLKSEPINQEVAELIWKGVTENDDFWKSDFTHQIEIIKVVLKTIEPLMEEVE